jgi:hypothetical protein
MGFEAIDRRIGIALNYNSCLALFVTYFISSNNSLRTLGKLVGSI